MWTTKQEDYTVLRKPVLTGCRDPEGLGSYPSQALFERAVDAPVSGFTKLFIIQEGQDPQKLLR